MSILAASERYSSSLSTLSGFPTTDRYQSTPIRFLTAYPRLLEGGYPGFLHIDISDFDFQISAALVDLILDWELGRVVIKSSIYNGVFLIATLDGTLTDDESEFQIHQVSVNMELEKETARTEFIASTLWAAITLADKIILQAPEIELNLNSKFHLSLLEISRLLQNRQTYYRLMVIERATGKRFKLPPSFSGSEMAAIVFAYRAIVDRSFIWMSDRTKVQEIAAQEILDHLPPNKTPTRHIISNHVSRVVLGEIISLGNGSMIIEDFFIENEDEVRRKLSANDGHLVEFTIGSLSGQALYKLPEAPRLPDSPWDSEIQKFIDLESKLDARLAKRYNDLAASTLEGLTEEEIKEVTSNPELDYRGFLGESDDTEDN